MKKILFIALYAIIMSSIFSLNGAANNNTNNNNTNNDNKKTEFYKAILGKPELNSLDDGDKLVKISEENPNSQEHFKQLYNHELIAKQLGKEKEILKKLNKFPYPSFEDTEERYKELSDMQLPLQEAKKILTENDKDETEDLNIIADIIRNAPLKQEQKKTYKDWYNLRLWQHRLDRLALYLWANRFETSRKDYPSRKDYQERLKAIKPPTLKNKLIDFIQNPSKEITVPKNYPKLLLEKHEKYNK